MPKKYLVTGGTGFIGAAFVEGLLDAGYDVRVLDNNSRGAMRRLKHIANEFEVVEADIRDFDSVKKAAKGVDAIAHLAYINGTEFFYSKPELVLDVGVKGMINVLDACRACKIGELILASSSEAYQTPPTVPTPEEVPLVIPDVMNPRYSYGGGKLISELMAVNYGRTGFDRVMIFRPHNIYGPDMGWEHVLPQLILRAIEQIEKHPSGKVPFQIKGDGTATRAFMNIEDCKNALVTIANKGCHMGIYHVGNPEELSITQVVKTLFEYLGREVDIHSSAAPEGETKRRCPDISKLKALGFDPKINLQDGLPRMVEWYRNNIHLKAA